MDYQESLDYLYSTINRGVKLGLENIRTLLQHFGNPQLQVSTFHIAGTNGKGSTAAMIASILQASGFRTGLFTSPHLHDFRERIRINGMMIAPEALAGLVTRIHRASEQTGVYPTYFELGTLMAFLHFQEQGVQWNVIEVGMGGRLDATNLCQARVSVITSIARDHMASLGEDLLAIAYEKACIIKGSGTVIAGIPATDILQVIEKQARSVGAPVYNRDRDFSATVIGHSWEGLEFEFSGFGKHLKNLKIPLCGRHQAENAALALAACLQVLEDAQSYSEEGIRAGLLNVRWPGRLEVVQRRPLVVLDGAHNSAGVKCLANLIRELCPENKVLLVLGILADKELAVMTKLFADFADILILCRPDHERAASPGLLGGYFENLGKRFEVIENVGAAVRSALDRIGPEDILCISGSLFTVAEARQVFDFKE